MKTKNLVRMSLFAALTVVCSQISIPLPFTPIPLTMSILAVFLTGALLPKYEAFLTQIVYLLIGVVGLPVFSGFGSGPAHLAGPTGGYLAAYPIMAFVVALAAEKRNDCSDFSMMLRRLGGMLAALLICYTLGTFWLAQVAGLAFQKALAAGVIPYIPLDLVKVGLSAAVAAALDNALTRAGLRG